MEVFVLFPATGVFELQLKLSSAFSQDPGHTCPGTTGVPFSSVQVFDPSSETVTCGTGTGVTVFVI